jgi:hypothetical protein
MTARMTEHADTRTRVVASIADSKERLAAGSGQWAVPNATREKAIVGTPRIFVYLGIGFMYSRVMT